MAWLQEIQCSGQPNYIVDLVGTEQRRRRLSKQVFDRHTQQPDRVAGCLQHLHRSGVQHKHGAVRQDRTGNVDRLPVAIRYVNRLYCDVIFSHAKQCSNRYAAFRKHCVCR